MTPGRFTKIDAALGFVADVRAIRTGFASALTTRPPLR